MIPNMAKMNLYAIFNAVMKSLVRWVHIMNWINPREPYNASLCMSIVLQRVNVCEIRS
jgi:hypothetical protein